MPASLSKCVAAATLALAAQTVAAGSNALRGSVPPRTTEAPSTQSETSHAPSSEPEATETLAAAQNAGNPKWCAEVPPAYRIQAGCTGGLPGAPALLDAQNLAAAGANGNPKWCAEVPPAYRI